MVLEIVDRVIKISYNDKNIMQYDDNPLPIDVKIPRKLLTTDTTLSTVNILVYKNPLDEDDIEIMQTDKLTFVRQDLNFAYYKWAIVRSYTQNTGQLKIQVEIIRAGEQEQEDEDEYDDIEDIEENTIEDEIDLEQEIIEPVIGIDEEGTWHSYVNTFDLGGTLKRETPIEDEYPHILDDMQKEISQLKSSVIWSRILSGNLIPEGALKLRIVESQEFELIEQKDNDTLYFLSDLRQIYKGNAQYSTDSVVFVDDFPTEDIKQDKLYVNKVTLEGKIYDGTEWILVFAPLPDTLVSSVNEILPVNGDVTITANDIYTSSGITINQEFTSTYTAIEEVAETAESAIDIALSVEERADKGDFQGQKGDAGNGLAAKIDLTDQIDGENLHFILPTILDGEFDVYYNGMQQIRNRSYEYDDVRTITLLTEHVPQIGDTLLVEYGKTLNITDEIALKEKIIILQDQIDNLKQRVGYLEGQI